MAGHAVDGEGSFLASVLSFFFFSDLRSSVNEIRLSSADPYIHGARLTSESSPHQVLDAY